MSSIAGDVTVAAFQAAGVRFEFHVHREARLNDSLTEIEQTFTRAVVLTKYGENGERLRLTADELDGLAAAIAETKSAVEEMSR